MTIYDQAWVAAEEAKRAWLDANSLLLRTKVAFAKRANTNAR
jgi:hypothetical protein